MDIFGISIILLYITVVVLWIYTLIKQAKKGEWVWFVFTLILNPTWLIYWIVKWLN